MQYKGNNIVLKKKKINKTLNWNLKPTGSLKRLKEVSTGLQRPEAEWKRLLQKSKCEKTQ